jgi:hypothetical protein
MLMEATASPASPGAYAPYAFWSTGKKDFAKSCGTAIFAIDVPVF